MRKETEKIMVLVVAKAKQHETLKFREGNIQPQQLHISQDKLAASIRSCEIPMN